MSDPNLTPETPYQTSDAAIRTYYALAATLGHGWAVALSLAGPCVREAAFNEARESEDVGPLNRRCIEQGLTTEDLRVTLRALATPEMSHVSKNGTIRFQVQRTGAAIIEVGNSRTLVVPGKIRPPIVRPDPRQEEIARVLALAVTTGERQRMPE